MTIDEALKAVSAEYDNECRRAEADATLRALMVSMVGTEYDEINKELPAYVGDIARGLGVKGAILPPWVYQTAIMCFRMGMRTQRKLDHPDEPTSMFWRSDRAAV